MVSTRTELGVTGKGLADVFLIGGVCVGVPLFRGDEPLEVAI